jgi:voltage-gated potassium channel Kch
MEVSSIAMLNAENGAPNANIKTASDALWWGYVTIATVGYGDKYPVTNQGRIVGLFVMTAGVGLFSVLTSFLADWFRRPRQVRRERRVLRPGGSSIESRQGGGDEASDRGAWLLYQQSMLDLKAKLAEIENYLS